LTATGKEAYTRSFTPLPDGFPHVPFNDMDALERAADDSTVGVMLEAIQGESGVNVATETYLRDVQDFCKAKGLLFMLDEVQTGIGRLGTLFGFERWGVEPDVATLAKGLGGGVPIGALLAKESASAFEPGDHGSTFAGGRISRPETSTTGTCATQGPASKPSQRKARRGALRPSVRAP